MSFICVYIYNKKGGLLGLLFVTVWFSKVLCTNWAYGMTTEPGIITHYIDIRILIEGEAQSMADIPILQGGRPTTTIGSNSENFTNSRTTNGREEQEPIGITFNL